MKPHLLTSSTIHQHSKFTTATHGGGVYSRMVRNSTSEGDVWG